MTPNQDSRKDIRQVDFEDIEIKEGVWGVLFDVEGYRLKKPIEVVVFSNVSGPERDETVDVFHYLPDIGKNVGGVEVKGSGESLEKAIEDFGEILGAEYDRLFFSNPTSLLSGDRRRRQYLCSILSKDYANKT